MEMVCLTHFQKIIQTLTHLTTSSKIWMMITMVCLTKMRLWLIQTQPTLTPMVMVSVMETEPVTVIAMQDRIHTLLTHFCQSILMAMDSLMTTQMVKADWLLTMMTTMMDSLTPVKWNVKAILSMQPTYLKTWMVMESVMQWMMILMVTVCLTSSKMILVFTIHQLILVLTHVMRIQTAMVFVMVLHPQWQAIVP